MKVAGILAGLVALVATSFASGASVPAGRIVFSATDAPATGDVMLVRADGSSVDLSRSPAYDTAPVLSPNGRLLATWARRGSAPGQFHRPAGVAVDARGNAYVSDTGNSRIQVLARRG